MMDYFQYWGTFNPRRRMPWRLDISDWRVLQVPDRETELDRSKRGMWEVAWVACWDRVRGAKRCTLRWSQRAENRLQCLDRTQRHCKGRTMDLELRGNGDLPKLDSSVTFEHQNENKQMAGRGLCGHQPWGKNYKVKTLVNDKKVERWKLRGKGRRRNLSV